MPKADEGSSRASLELDLECESFPTMVMKAAPILLLGDPVLRVRATEVERFDDAHFREGCARLAATLDEFRRTHRFGRAIAAPQIGVSLRFIAVNLGEGTFFIVNPVVTARTEETFTLWDDCMSFPDLLVRLRRVRSLSLSYVDEDGRPKEWRDLDQPSSELLQHEIDHLDGVLAVDRRLEGNSLLMRSLYDARRDEFAAMVDYTIRERSAAP